jgi:hypothetical protein
MAISCAILGLYFSISESYLSNLADGRVPDELCTLGAGVLLCFGKRGPGVGGRGRVFGLGVLRGMWG